MTARWIMAAALAGVVFGSETALAQLTGDQRDEFIKGSFQACNDAAGKNFPTIPADTVKTYCQCMAEKEADMTTQADIAYVSEHQAGSDDYKARIVALVPICRAQAGLK
jgi:hypothetical protein